MGWPTANVAVPEGLEEAADGVYAAWVEVAGETGAKAGETGAKAGETGAKAGETGAKAGERHGAMANLGVKPTFGGGGGRILELHLFDFDGDIYGREISAELVARIRPERKFENPAALRSQIAEDEKSIKKILCT